MQSKARTYAALMVQALDGATEKEAQQVIQRFKDLLYKRGDFKHISSILREFERAWQERNGKTATVVSAHSLAEKTKTEMAKSLEKKGYALQEKVDPAVIGGTALYLGSDYMIDSTVKGKLNRLSKLLKQNG
ncbi:MAG TPA: F0F1 ATP synthase subunit delta [Candidatus Paceibacterota bacterium]